jgi:rRNA maturation endonuclease Nob1
VKLPSWEISKELADKLPGEKGDPKENECPECGHKLEEDPTSKKDKKGK